MELDEKELEPGDPEPMEVDAAAAWASRSPARRSPTGKRKNKTKDVREKDNETVLLAVQHSGMQAGSKSLCKCIEIDVNKKAMQQTGWASGSVTESKRCASEGQTLFSLGNGHLVWNLEDGFPKHNKIELSKAQKIVVGTIAVCARGRCKTLCRNGVGVAYRVSEHNEDKAREDWKSLEKSFTDNCATMAIRRVLFSCFKDTIEALRSSNVHIPDDASGLSHMLTQYKPSIVEHELCATWLTSMPSMVQKLLHSMQS